MVRISVINSLSPSHLIFFPGVLVHVVCPKALKLFIGTERASFCASFNVREIPEAKSILS
jgi:hypothetical protein